jgi:hypothetical protein
LIVIIFNFSPGPGLVSMSCIRLCLMLLPWCLWLVVVFAKRVLQSDFWDNCIGIGLLLSSLVKQKRVPTQGGNKSFCPHEVDSLFSTQGGMLWFPHEVECSDFHL